MERERLLIVDDHAGMRELFTFHMHREGFRVDEAEDGFEALANVARARPDLIVLDLMLPRLDGWGVLKALRERGLAGIPVIVVTGYSEAFDREAIAREPAVVDYMTKPIKYSDLVARIRSVLGKEGGLLAVDPGKA